MTTSTNPERTDELLRLLGDPQKALQELEQTKRSAQALSSDHPRLIDEYPQRWVALHDGVVIADAETIEALLAEIDEKDPASRSHVLIRFIEKNSQMWFF